MVAYAMKPKKDKNVGFFADPTTYERIRDRAEHTSDGNVSRHLRALVQADIDGVAFEPTKEIDSDIVVQLARAYAGYLAPKLDHALASTHTDQPELLHRLLVALTEHLARGHDAADLVIVPRSEWHPQPYQHLHAAEAPAPYKSTAAPTPHPGPSGSTPAVPHAS